LNRGADSAESAVTRRQDDRRSWPEVDAELRSSGYTYLEGP